VVLGGWGVWGVFWVSWSVFGFVVGDLGRVLLRDLGLS